MHPVRGLYGVGTPCEINDAVAILDLDFGLRQLIKNAKLVILAGPILLDDLSAHKHCVQVENGLLMIQYLQVLRVNVINGEQLLAVYLVD